MKEKNRKYLKSAIRELPDFSPDNSLWKNISKKIYINNLEINRDILKNSIKGLPVFTPEKNAWNNIKENIKTRSKTILLNSWKLYVTGIAASFILFFSILYVNIKNSQSDITITYEDFSAPIFDDSLFEIEGNSKIEKYIYATCSQLPQKCNSSEYSNYQNELIELKNELIEMKKNIKEFNEDIEYVKYYIRIEKQIDDLNKNFMNYLMI